jgi:hypothetical protein
MGFEGGVMRQAGRRGGTREEAQRTHFRTALLPQPRIEQLIDSRVECGSLVVVSRPLHGKRIAECS